MTHWELALVQRREESRNVLVDLRRGSHEGVELRLEPHAWLRVAAGWPEGESRVLEVLDGARVVFCRRPLTGGAELLLRAWPEELSLRTLGESPSPETHATPTAAAIGVELRVELH